MKRQTINGERVDLHVHTTYSDGIMSPAEVVEAAAKLNLRGVAITDHDAIGGVAEAVERGRELGVVVVPGVEISAGMDRQEVHILGYFFDHTDKKFREKLEGFQASRLVRIQEMVKRLRSMGLRIDFERVVALGGEGAVGRPHVAMALVEKGYIGSMAEAFESLIGDNGPAYSQRARITPALAVEMIHEAGGVAGWAHPGLEGHDEWFDEFVEMGIDLLEVVHPEHSNKEANKYRVMAESEGLIAVGGSDCHGALVDGRLALGRYTVEFDTVAKLREKAREIGGGVGRE